MLSVEAITVGYSAAPVLHSLSLQVKENEIVALIGANGAGKTTLMKAISRLLPLRAGGIHFDGRDITNRSTAAVVRMGISHVPEGRRVFREMTVEENLQMGAYSRRRQADLEAELGAVFEMFGALFERRHQRAETLSGGEQQMLAIGRALMAKPRLLLLDEPSMGLAPMLVARIFDFVQAIRRQGTTILLVEQNAAIALRVSDRAYVLETGQIALAGDSRALASDPRIVSAYLGGQI